MLTNKLIISLYLSIVLCESSIYIMRLLHWSLLWRLLFVDLNILVVCKFKIRKSCNYAIIFLILYIFLQLNCIFLFFEDKGRGDIHRVCKGLTITISVDLLMLWYWNVSTLICICLSQLTYSWANATSNPCVDPKVICRS